MSIDNWPFQNARLLTRLFPGQLTRFGGGWLNGVAVLLSLTLLGGAQSPQQPYDISWWTVDGGGVTFTTGDGYRLGGGFWRGGEPSMTPSYGIYLPLVLRN